MLAVVIDTEEEFDWNRPFNRANVAVTSMSQQDRMQEIFRRHAIIPTYVVDYPVASTASSRDYLRGLLDKGACEIGAHLHPWVNPPYEEEVCVRNSFPGNLPPDLERRKVTVLTDAIAEGFGIRPRVYKAGRYGIGPATPAILEELGYDVDASVMPHTDFSAATGPDFRDRPDRPHWIGRSRPLLEIPLSVGFTGALAAVGAKLFPFLDGPLARRLHLPGMAARSGLLERIPLTPEGVDLAALKRLTRSLIAQGHRVLSFCYHSPSLGLGHTPYVRTARQLRDFLATSDAFFAFFADEIGGLFTTPARLFDRLRPTASTSGNAS